MPKTENHQIAINTVFLSEVFGLNKWKGKPQESIPSNYLTILWF